MATEFKKTNLISQVKLPGSDTVYEIADADVRVVVNKIENDFDRLDTTVAGLTAGGLSYKIVTALPEGDEIEANKVYLIADENADAGVYLEYLSIGDDKNRTLEQIGSTKMDMSNYEEAITSITVPSYDVSGTASVGKASIVPAKANGQAATVITEGEMGSAASWGATVLNGILEFSWTANTPTTVATFGSVDVATVDTEVTNVATIDAAASVVTGIHTNGTVNATINH